VSSLAERVRRCVPKLGPAERRVAEAVLRDYPVIALERVASIAEQAQVSPPTVLRFVGKLGFSSLEEFRSAARAEIGERLASPLARFGARERADVGRAEAQLVEQIRRSFVGLDQEQLMAAVNLLADVERRVVVLGGRVSDVLARHLAWSLEVLRPGVRHVGASGGERVNALLDVDASSVVVAFDFQRYQLDTVRFVELAAERGASILVVTDSGLSPAVARADVVLASSIEGPGIFDALTPAFALVEAVVAALVEALGEGASARLADYERLTAALLEVER